MNPKKAIEILRDSIADNTLLITLEHDEAVKLGIEALKFRLRWEQQEGEDDFPLLPGETKD